MNHTFPEAIKKLLRNSMYCIRATTCTNSISFVLGGWNLWNASVPVSPIRPETTPQSFYVLSPSIWLRSLTHSPLGNTSVNHDSSLVSACWRNLCGVMFSQSVCLHFFSILTLFLSLWKSLTVWSSVTLFRSNFLYISSYSIIHLEAAEEAVNYMPI